MAGRRPAAWLCPALLPAVEPTGGVPIATEASAAQIADYLRRRGKRVLSFTGYSSAGYQDPRAMLACADAVLAAHDPERTLVNIGATAIGIGAVYEPARRRGFHTLGIVSTLARERGQALSPWVERVFYVRDGSWGGWLPGTRQLAPTSAAMVSNTDVLVAIGGGEIAAAELIAARAAGKAVAFYPADMDHELARARARARGSSPPRDFGGAARHALGG